MSKTKTELASELKSLKAKYAILRQFLKDQEWTDGPDADQCPWCGVPEKAKRHDYGCYFAEVDERTK